MTDNVNSPMHYIGDIECIDAIEASMSPSAFRGYLKGNVQKYIWRYETKNPENRVEDLRKAEWYLKRLISLKLEAIAETAEFASQSPLKRAEMLQTQRGTSNDTNDI
jgi:hypothetical protein